MKSFSGGLLSGIFTFSSLTLLSRVLGQLRSTLFAALLGTSYLADIFYLAFKVPNLFRRVFAEGAMNAAFLPIFNQLHLTTNQHHLEGSNTSDSFPVLSEKDFLSLIAFSLGGILFLFLGLVIFFAPEIVSFLFFLKPKNSSFLLQQERETIWLLCVMLPYLGFISFSALYQSVLQSKKKFGIPASTPILFNLVLIVTATGLLVFPEDQWGVFLYEFSSLLGGGISEILKEHPPEYFRVMGLAVSVLLGGMFQLIYPWWYVRKLGFRLNFKIFFLNRYHPKLQKFFKLMIPVIFSSGIYQINVLLVDPIALSLEEGTVAFLFYANRLMELPLGIIGVSVATVSLPLFSKLSFEKDQSVFLDILKRTVNLLFLSIPLVLFVSLLFYKEIVSLLFQFKNFGTNSVEKTASCFFVYTLGLPAIFFYRLLNQVFFAKNNTRTPFYSALLTLLCSLSLTVFLVSIFPEAVSIAWASTISSYLVLAYLLWNFQTKLSIRIVGFMLERVKYYLKWSFLPVVFTLALYHVYRWSDWFQYQKSDNTQMVYEISEIWQTKFFQLGEISSFTLVFLICYATFLYWGKEEETVLILNRIKERVF